MRECMALDRCLVGFVLDVVWILGDQDRVGVVRSLWLSWSSIGSQLKLFLVQVIIVARVLLKHFISSDLSTLTRQRQRPPSFRALFGAQTRESASSSFAQYCTSLCSLTLSLTEKSEFRSAMSFLSVITYNQSQFLLGLRRNWVNQNQGRSTVFRQMARRYWIGKKAKKYAKYILHYEKYT